MVEKLILPCSVQKHIGGRTIKMELVLTFFSWVMFTKEVKLCYKVTNVTNIFDTLMYILSLSLFLWLWLWMGSLYSRSYLVSLSSLRLFCGQREICRFEIPIFFQYFKKKNQSIMQSTIDLHISFHISLTIDVSAQWLGLIYVLTLIIRTEGSLVSPRTLTVL